MTMHWYHWYASITVSTQTLGKLTDFINSFNWFEKTKKSDDSKFPEELFFLAYTEAEAKDRMDYIQETEMLGGWNCK